MIKRSNALRRAFAEKMKRNRLTKGFTKAHAARAAGINRSTYLNYEAGDSEPSLFDGLRICALLDIDPWDLPLDPQTTFDLDHEK